MLTQYTSPEVAEKIGRLISVLNGKESPDVIAKEINDILIYGDKIPFNIVSSAWDYFAKRKGVNI